MNNKLRHYPEFAQATGLTEIKNCADGRAFSKTYRDYSVAYPHFDKGERYEKVPFQEPERPTITAEDLRAAEGDGPKIKNGTGDGLSPVVRIYSDQYDGKTHYCTGTFIGRNWILTAAHCLQWKNGWKNGIDATASGEFKGWYKRDVEFFDTQGKKARRQTFSAVRQYLDPRYTGWDPGGLGIEDFRNPYNAFDVALLYIDSSFDGMLPNMDPSLTVTKFPLMRVSAEDHIVDVPTASVWGAGLIDNSVAVPNGGSGGSGGTGGTGGTGGVAGNNNSYGGRWTFIPTEASETSPRLRRGSLAPYATTFDLQPEPPKSIFSSTPIVPRTIYGQLYYADYPGVGAAYTCLGDSGGPLVELWTIKDPSGNSIAGYVEGALLSENTYNELKPCTSDADCASISQTAVCDSDSECYDPVWKCQDRPGLGSGWVPTGIERDWIGDTVSNWYKSNFRCNNGRRVDAGGNLSDDFIQCWGNACKKDKDCANENQYCSRPGSTLGKNCIACPGKNDNSPDKCACYYGQCFNKAPLK